MATLQYQRIQTYLEKLKLATMIDRLDTISEQTAKDQGSYLDFLEALLDAEVTTRSEKNVALKMRMARFPYHKSLDDFDFSFQRSIDGIRLHGHSGQQQVARPPTFLLGCPDFFASNGLDRFDSGLTTFAAFGDALHAF